MLGQFADNLTINDLYTAPEGFKSRHETGKAWAMMHPMKFEDPDGFRRNALFPLRRLPGSGKLRALRGIVCESDGTEEGAEARRQTHDTETHVATPCELPTL